MQLKLLMILLCLTSVPTLAQTKRYDQQIMGKIKLLTTTKEEVEQLINRKIENHLGRATVDVPQGVIIFEFSIGRCNEDINSGWDVSDGIITSVNFSPTKKSRASDFDFRLMRVIKEPGNGVIYTNEASGVTYHTQLKRVELISYEPPAEYEYLRCKQKKDKH